MATMSKYAEYRAKALQLDGLVKVLTSDHIRVQTVALGGHIVRVTKKDGKTIIEIVG